MIISDKIRNTVLKQFYLFVYRLMALFALGSALLFMVGYGLIMLFFMFNTTWIGPTVLAKTSDKMMQFSQGYQLAVQAMTTDEVLRDQSNREYAIAVQNNTNLTILADEFEKYRVAVKTPVAQKDENIKHSIVLSNELDQNKASIKKSLDAGLMTKVDAVAAYTNIQQFKNMIPDAMLIAHGTSITALQQYVQIQALLQQSESDVQTKKAAAEAAKINYDIAAANINALKDSAYYDAYYNNGSNLAFIPYENMSKLKVGAPIYGCYVSFLWCHQVGTVKKIYTDEQLVQFPLFNVRLNRTDRGVFIDMDLTEKKWAKETVLFINHKPLLL